MGQANHNLITFITAFNVVDWAFLGLFACSVIIAIFRGFIKEGLSLVGWVVAVLAARWFALMLGPDLARAFAMPVVVGYIACGVLVAVLVKILFLMIFLPCKRWIEERGLSGLDRALGAVFGALRGVIILLLIVALGLAVQPLHEHTLWQSSQLLPVGIEWFGQLVALFAESQSAHS